MQPLKCRFCESLLSHTFCDLGKTPLANSYLTRKDLQKEEPFYPLHAYVCASCLLVQLPTLHTPHEIFEEYAYFSSYSSSWLNHAKKYAEMAVSLFQLNSHSNVVEIASNDGYLLQYFQQLNIPILGIEPAKNVAETALKKGIPTLVDFFGSSLVKEEKICADLLVGNNVLAHVPNLNDFVLALKQALKKDGVITMEFPHLLNLVELSQFDTIYHEHFSYFSFYSVKKVFEHHGLEIFDVESLSTHGGSLRIFAKHTGGKHARKPSVGLLEQQEKEKGLHELSTYLAFQEKIAHVKKEILKFFQFVKENKKSVVGYGAPAKGNTLLNFCGINANHMPFTVDKNPSKQGKFLPGTHLPIFSVEKIKEVKPDYLLILPWNLKEEIKEELKEIRSWGGKFVISIPRVEII